MDCTKLPRTIVFKDRRNLEDFVRNNRINEIVLSNMLEIDFLKSHDFKDRVLKYFNTAYYICIMIMYEEYPEWSLPKYYDLAYCGKSDDYESQATTLSLVLLLLRKIYQNPAPKYKKIIDKIDNFLDCHAIPPDDMYDETTYYYSVYEWLCEGITSEMVLIPNEFVLRKIDKQTIEDLQSSGFTWTKLTEYYNCEVMFDIAMSIGKNEEEQMLICESMDYDARKFYGENSPNYKDGAKIRINTMRQKIYKVHHQEAEDELYQDMKDAESKQLYSGESKKVDALKEKINGLEEQLDKVRKQEKGICLGINQAQTALFGLSLANAFAFDYSNKKKDLAPMLHKLFGWGEAKIAAYMSNPCEKK